MQNERQWRYKENWILNNFTESRSSKTIRASENFTDYYHFNFGVESQILLTKLNEFTVSPDIFQHWQELNLRFRVKTDWTRNDFIQKMSIGQERNRIVQSETVKDLQPFQAIAVLNSIIYVKKIKMDFEMLVEIKGVNELIFINKILYNISFQFQREWYQSPLCWELRTRLRPDSLCSSTSES